MKTFVVETQEDGSHSIVDTRDESEYMNIGTQPCVLANMYCDLLNYGVEVGHKEGVKAGFEQATLNAKNAQKT